MAVIRAGAPLAAVLLFFAVPGQCLALGIANISQSSGTLPVTWSNAGTTDRYLSPDANDALTVTGTMQTTPLTGSGSITITAPATITGTNGAPLDVSRVSVTCSGSAISGQAYVASLTPLVPGGSVTCATYAAGFVSLSVQVTVQFFLDDRAIPADSYASGLGAFGIVANAS